MVYDPMLEGERLIFGVSGALYKSSAVLYDRQTESLWAQPTRQAVAGELTGASLGVIPSIRVRWSVWLKQHPDTLVLSADTGYPRNYNSDPYAEYHESPEMFFRVSRKKSECKIHSKERVLGVEVDGLYRAYKMRDLKKAGRVRDRIGTKTLEILYDKQSDSAKARFEDGSPANGIVIYWFAWHAFHPDTDCGSRM